MDGYDKADIIASGSDANVDTTEVDIVEVTDLGATTATQLTLYVSVADIGTHTSVKFRVYYRGEKSGSYHQLMKHNISTGAVEDMFFSFAAAANAVIDLGMSGNVGYKITAQGVDGADASVTVKVLARNN